VGGGGCVEVLNDTAGQVMRSCDLV
jgi:hypothetical protein